MGPSRALWWMTTPGRGLGRRCGGTRTVTFSSANPCRPPRAAAHAPPRTAPGPMDSTTHHNSCIRVSGSGRVRRTPGMGSCHCPALTRHRIVDRLVPAALAVRVAITPHWLSAVFCQECWPGPGAMHTSLADPRVERNTVCRAVEKPRAEPPTVDERSTRRACHPRVSPSCLTLGSHTRGRWRCSHPPDPSGHRDGWSPCAYGGFS